MNHAEIINAISKLSSIDDINKIIENCNKRIDIIHHKEDILLEYDLRKCNNKICLLHEAFMHYNYGIKPKTKELGYIMAKIDFSEESKNFNEFELEVYRKIIKKFYVSDYVFRYTHYDSCSNGRYYRMS